jgi:hypothetical protein
VSTFEIAPDVDAGGLLATMLRPDNPGHGEVSYILYLAQKHPEISLEDTYLKQKIGGWAIEGAFKHNQWAEICKNSTSASVAGDVLKFLVDMDYGGVEEPSLKKARWLASNFHKRAVHTGQHKIGYSEAAIKNYWQQYRRVVHLWAAFRVSGPDVISKLVKNPRAFLIMAKFYQHYADNFLPSRSQNPEPLLPVNAWRVSDTIPLINPAPPYTLASWMEETLKRYHAAK